MKHELYSFQKIIANLHYVTLSKKSGVNVPHQMLKNDFIVNQ